MLAIDQGTTGTTVALVDSAGSVLGSVTHEFPQYYPKAGWVEHDAEDIWASVIAAIGALMRKRLVKVNDIAGIGITNQRETALAWHRDTGAALNRAIVWQCRRTTSICERLRAEGLEPLVRQRTGLMLDPYFSATKFSWLLRHSPGARALVKKGKCALGTVDSFLLWRLTQGSVHATDVSNASRTSLFNIDTMCWDPALCDAFDVPLHCLPEVMPTSFIVGRTKGVPGLPDGIPIGSLVGDQQSALFGQACFKLGDAKCTFGTGSFILYNTGSTRHNSQHGLLTTVAWQLGLEDVPTYALEGGAFVCGAAVQWLRDELGFVKSARDIEALAAQVSDTGGVEFVPALTGLGAPYWQPEARGLLLGLTRGTSRAHIARATLDAMALQNVDILKAMEHDTGSTIRSLKVDGGAAENNLLMQSQADYLGRGVIRPKVIETTVMGAAFLAGLAVGLWSSPQDISKIWQADERFRVKLTPTKRAARLAAWHRAVAHTIAMKDVSHG
jgi:glycerol kinase